jgi:ABC-2 type transport system permease protein
MSLTILTLDEVNGFYRSRLMAVLWVGLPLMALVSYMLVPGSSLDGVPFTIVTSILVASIGALLASVMLAVNVVNEINDHALDLFLVRPVKRWHLLVSKLLAVYSCVTVACLLALSIGLAFDYLFLNTSSAMATDGLLESLAITLMMMSISCCAALLIATFSPSVLVAVILVVFGANQLSALVLLPVFMSELSMTMTFVASCTVSILMAVLALFLFQRREL